MNKWLDYCVERASSLPIQSYKQRHYAVLLSRKGEMLAEAANDPTKSHPLHAQYARRVGREEAIFRHAESGALIVCARNGRVGDIHTLVVARVDKKGSPVYSCPCSICSLMAKEFGVKNVSYTM